MIASGIHKLATEIGAEIVRHAPFTSRADQIQDLATGYAVQDALVDHLIERGLRGAVTGYKVAANSRALMDLFNLPEPVSARVFVDQRHDSPALLRRVDFNQFAFEPEIAAILGADLPVGAVHDRASARAAVARFVPAFELLDLRQVDPPRAHMPDMVAANISNEGIVLGGPGVATDVLDPAGIRAEVLFDGAVVQDVTGAAPQNPLDVVAWLANHLGARGLGLSAGMVVLCGTHTPIQRPDGASRIALRMTGLGEVTADIS